MMWNNPTFWIILVVAAVTVWLIFATRASSDRSEENSENNENRSQDSSPRESENQNAQSNTSHTTSETTSSSYSGGQDNPFSSTREGWNHETETPNSDDHRRS